MQRKEFDKITEEIIESCPKEPSAPVKSKKRKKTSLDYAIELLIKVAVTVVLVLIVCLFIIGIHINHGNSSYPMIKDGDLVITFRLSDLKQGDEVGYTVDGTFKLGRVVAVGGDEVDINDSFVSVNGFGIAEDVVYPTSSSGAKVDFPYQVPEGYVFMLNDFRSDNEDSRTYGAISCKDCEGKVVFIMRRRGI